MALVNKIDSNIVELRFAEEASIGVLPGTPVWIPMDPNSYSDFGADLKTVARNPINASRQRKKGVIVDLDAKGGFEIDLTQDNMQSLVQGFMFALMRTNAELQPPSTDGAAHGYVPTSGGAAYFANNLLWAKNFTFTANNGLKTVTGTPTNTQVLVTDTGIVTENGSSGTISRVGHQFGATVAAIDASGPLPKLTISGVAAASVVGTTTGNFANAETVTLNGKVYTFQTVLTAGDGNVKVAASAQLSLANLANAINRNGVGVPDTDFSSATTAHPTISATSGVSTITCTARQKGALGNALTSTETGANFSFASATLLGGTGNAFQEFGLVVGQWMCLGDDSAAFQFATAANNGLKRIRVIADDNITFDKSTQDMVTDAGTGKTIRIIFGRICKNETGSLVVRKSYQLEQTLGAPDDALPTQIQSQYLTGAIANEFTLDVKQADKLTASLTFLGRDVETRTGATGVKSGTRPTLKDATAFNSTSNIARASMAVITQTDAAPTELFAFIEEIKLTINNNVKAAKAIKFLGAFDNTAGTFQVSAEVTAYFQNVTAIQSVRANSDVTLDMTFASGNQGITIDLPLVSLGKALPAVKQDEAIKIPLSADAATGSKIDTNLNHTTLFQFWDYLPTLAA